MKEQIRKEILAKRNSLSTKEKSIKDAKIKDTLFSLKEFDGSKNVMSYVSFNGEVDTKKIINDLLENKTKNVIVPYVLKNNKSLQISKLHKLSDLCVGSKGILEPKIKRRSNFDINNIDLVIIPGIAFDKSGDRIGYGFGYYDIFLKDLKALKIALAYDCQIVNNIKAEKYDVKMDIIITDNEIIRTINK